MLRIKIGFDGPFWKNCKLAPRGRQGRFDLKTPLDSAATFFKTELSAKLEETPENERDLLVVTGPVYWEVGVLAGMIINSLACKFKRVEIHTNRGTITFETQQET